MLALCRSIVYLAGLNLLPGSKRKLAVDTDGQCDATPMPYESSANSDYWIKPKRAKMTGVPKKYGCWDSDLDCAVDITVDSQADVNWHNSRSCLQSSPSACAIEDCLSKGFEGHLSIGCCFQFDQKNRFSYT